MRYYTFSGLHEDGNMYDVVVKAETVHKAQEIMRTHYTEFKDWMLVNVEDYEE